jgi:hypothetical protein
MPVGAWKQFCDDHDSPWFHTAIKVDPGEQCCLTGCENTATVTVLMKKEDVA